MPATMSLPKEMQAIVYHGKEDQSVRTIPLPTLRPTYLLIKVSSVALNPTDWKHTVGGKGAEPFSILGCDFAGTVVSIGASVTKPFQIGDQVYGCVHGGNQNEPYDGAFAEYIVAKGDLVMHAPTNSSPSLEELATIGLGAYTVGQGLFQPGKGLGLAWPEQGKGNGEWLLVYGGSTATGTLGIQFAKLAGYKVITTCSPRNNDLVKSRGADEIFDYNDPSCGAKIRALTNNKLKYAWDCFAGSLAPGICAEALSSDSSIAHYGSILSHPLPREDVKLTFTLMYTIFGEAFSKYGEEFPADVEDFEFAKKWMRVTESLVRDGKVKPHPSRVEGGGLEGVLKGLEDMKAWRVSGVKLVYRI